MGGERESGVAGHGAWTGAHFTGGDGLIGSRLACAALAAALVAPGVASGSAGSGADERITPAADGREAAADAEPGRATIARGRASRASRASLGVAGGARRATVPEPASIALIGGGMLGIGAALGVRRLKL